MKEIKTIEEGVKKLFELKGKQCPKYFKKEGTRFDSIVLNEKEIPLLYARYNTKHCHMRELKVLGSPCAITGYFVAPYELEWLCFYEMTCCEWILKSTINKAKCYKNRNTANLMLWFKNGATAFIQIHSAKFGNEEFKHEYFTTEGMAADMAVDTVVRQKALNVFLPEGNEYYTDSDNELYGLELQDVDKVYCIYNTIYKDFDEILNTTNRLNKIIDFIMESDKEVKEGVDF